MFVSGILLNQNYIWIVYNKQPYFLVVIYQIIIL
jgi:hypothetical protein